MIIQVPCEQGCGESLTLASVTANQDILSKGYALAHLGPGQHQLLMGDRDPISFWPCGGCGLLTSVRHFLQRDGITVHDPEAAYREAVGLDEPEPVPADANGSNEKR